MENEITSKFYQRNKEPTMKCIQLCQNRNKTSQKKNHEMHTRFFL